MAGTGVEQPERPHKPVLLLAALDHLDDGGQTLPIPWTETLVQLFKLLFRVVRASNTCTRTACGSPFEDRRR
jgi:hypothetical protein